MDALAYHEATKHSVESVRRGGGLDFSNRPTQFKKYVGLGSVPLPAEYSDVVHLSGGITKWLHGMPFRANACTGALYHIEIHLLTEKGVFHIDLEHETLVTLRAGDCRAALASAGGDAASASLLFTTTFWRNAWKYRTRMYRHAFWDLGTMLANTLAVTGGHVLAAFADDEVNHLLGLDPTREVALAIVPLGPTREPLPASPAVEPLDLKVVPYSRFEIDYPEIGAAHRASCLSSGQEAEAWRSAPLPAVPLDLWGASLADVIRRRGSSRQFDRMAPITRDQLTAVLDLALTPIAADFPPMVDLYVIAHAVDGLPAGAYAVDRATRGLGALRKGDFRQEAGLLDLGQPLAADAAFNVYSLVDLAAVIERLGNRGYRAAQLEGGIIGGRIYLAAYALRLGATGLTFFDDLVTQFFSPHAAGKSVMFLSAVGHPARALM